jgi:chromosome partitioning protein
MRKIAVCLSKGGVGKTTTAVNLSAGLALKGYRVLLVDTDTQGQVSRMLGINPDAGLAEVISGEMKLQEVRLAARDNLWVLGGGRPLAGIRREMAQMTTGGERVLKDALSSARGYDYIILDTAPGWDAMTVNVLFYAVEILCPVSLEVLTVDGLMAFQESVSEIQAYNKKLVLKYILPNFLDGRVKKSGEILQQIKNHYKDLVCPPIRYNVRISEAPGYGQSIFEYAPSSPGSVDYQNLIERISDGGK